MQLENKVAFITGGSQGMGAAEARMFVSRGAQVVVGDIQDEAGEALVRELGDAALYVHLDVTSEADWSRAIEATLARFGKLDVMVGNAGISPPPKPIQEISLEEYQRVINVNQIGCFLTVKASIDPMLAAGGGSIVLISSTAGLEAVGGLAPYSTSKAAVTFLAKVSALDLARQGIRVNSVHPGPIDTPMTQPGSWGGFDMRPLLAKGNPLGRIAKAEEVAEVVAFLASDASGYCTGSALAVDGGQTAGIFMDHEKMRSGKSKR